MSHTMNLNGKISFGLEIKKMYQVFVATIEGDVIIDRRQMFVETEKDAQLLCLTHCVEILRRNLCSEDLIARTERLIKNLEESKVFEEIEPILQVSGNRFLLTRYQVCNI